MGYDFVIVIDTVSAIMLAQIMVLHTLEASSSSAACAGQ